MHPPHGHMARALATVLDDGAAAEADAVVGTPALRHEAMIARDHGAGCRFDGGRRGAGAHGIRGRSRTANPSYPSFPYAHALLRLQLH